MATISHYQIKEFDTLESIAGRFLNDADRWIEIVQANNLRYPFISSDPKYQLGVILVEDRLGIAVPAGTTQYTAHIPAPELATARGAFYIEQITNTGRKLSETVKLAVDGQAIDENNVVLTFATPLVNSYDKFATWSLTSNPDLQTSKVAKPGDVLALANANFQDKVDTRDEFDRLLGTDISLDDKTRQLRWDSTTHDLQTVSGVENLRQACYLKLMTNQGELVYHPTYGDRLLQFVGAANTPVIASMANGILRECILQDPRVFSVENMVVKVQGDTLTAEFRIRVRGIDTLIQVTSLGIKLV